MTNKLKLTLSIGLGTFLSFVLFFASEYIATSSNLGKLELKLQDNLLKVRKLGVSPSNKILLFELDEVFFRPEFQGNTQLFYNKITDWLLQQDAKIILLNLPYELRETSFSNNIQPDNINLDIDFFINLINKYKNRIVLISPVHRISNSNHNEIANYRHYLIANDCSKVNFAIVSSQKQPCQEKNSISYPSSAKEVQAFFEYENLESETPSNLNSPARRAYSQGKLKVGDLVGNSSKQELDFDSFAWLALRKYYRNFPSKNPIVDTYPSQIIINYYFPHTFAENTLKLSQLCKINYEKNDSCEITSTRQQREKIKDKIVIMGFTAVNDSDILPVQSTFGTKISGMEAQASVVSNLITKSYSQTLPKAAVMLIYLVSGAIIGGVMASSSSPHHWLYSSLGMVGVYGSLTVVASYSGWILPIFSPLLSALMTVGFITFYLKNNELIEENQRKKRIIAEEEALISKAKHLIRRVWGDVHEKPLQELKIAMYELEFLSLPDAEKETIIRRLSSVGQEIRSHLTLDLDSVLTIKPELREGLIIAMRKYLQELIHSGQLKSEIITNLQVIKEDELNSDWILAREGIFRFFCEAINNIIYHASSAQQIRINLTQTEKEFCLSIENDGEIKADSTLKIKESLGTKLITEVAENLPNGSWERITLPDGGIQVKLMWTHSFEQEVITSFD